MHYQNVFLSDKNVAARLDVSRATIWRWAQAGDFPKPVKLSVHCTRWRSQDIEKWEESRFGGAA